MKREKTTPFAKDPEKLIRQAISQFVRTSPANRRKTGRGKYMDAPLVGFASGKDPLFRQYKKIIGRFHYYPSRDLCPDVPEGAPPGRDVCYLLGPSDQ